MYLHTCRRRKPTLITCESFHRCETSILIELESCDVKVWILFEPPTYTLLKVGSHSHLTCHVMLVNIIEKLYLKHSYMYTGMRWSENRHLQAIVDCLQKLAGYHWANFLAFTSFLGHVWVVKVVSPPRLLKLWMREYVCVCVCMWNAYTHTASETKDNTTINTSNTATKTLSVSPRFALRRLVPMHSKNQR